MGLALLLALVLMWAICGGVVTYSDQRWNGILMVGGDYPVLGIAMIIISVLFWPELIYQFMLHRFIMPFIGD